MGRILPPGPRSRRSRDERGVHLSTQLVHGWSAGCGRPGDRGVADGVRAGGRDRRTGPRLLPAEEAARKGLREGRHPAVHRQHAVHQHHPQEQGTAVRRRPGDRAAHQEHRALERHGHGGARQQVLPGRRRPHLHLRLGGHPLPGRLPSLLPRPRRGRVRRRHALHPGPRLPGHLRQRLPRRPHLDPAARGLPARARAGWRPLLLSASLADAGLLGVPHGLHGPVAHLRHLPGQVQPLPAQPRPARPPEPQDLGVPRRRRDR